MAGPMRRQQAIGAQTITASGNSIFLQNLGRDTNPTVIGYLDCGVVSGTTPNITISVYGSEDGVRFTPVPLASFAAITATPAGPQRMVIANVLDPYLYVAWVVTGTTPSFATVNCDLYFTAPDA